MFNIKSVKVQPTYHDCRAILHPNPGFGGRATRLGPGNYNLNDLYARGYVAASPPSVIVRRNSGDEVHEPCRAILCKHDYGSHNFGDCTNELPVGEYNYHEMVRYIENDSVSGVVVLGDSECRL